MAKSMFKIDDPFRNTPVYDVWEDVTEEKEFNLEEWLDKLEQSASEERNVLPKQD